MIPDDIKAVKRAAKYRPALSLVPDPCSGMLCWFSSWSALWLSGGVSRLSWRAPCCWPPPRFFPL